MQAHLSIMASLIRRSNGKYYISFYDATRTPKRKYVSTRTPRRKEAERLLHKAEPSLLSGHFDPWRGDDIRIIDLPIAPQSPRSTRVPIGKATREFLESRSNLTPSTQERYRSICERFSAFVGLETEAATLTTSDVQCFIHSTDTKPITRLNYRKALHTLFAWMEERGAVASNPTCAVRLERVPQKYPRYLTKEDVRALCECIEVQQCQPHVEQGTGLWLIPIIRANVYLGLRAGELVNLMWEDVDIERRKLTIRNREGFVTKAGKERVLPLSGPVLEVISGLDRVCPYVFPNHGGTKLHRQYLSRAFKRFVRMASLPEYINFHTTRHTAASWLVEAGCHIEAVRRFMGHSSVTVTEKYLHMKEDAFHNLILNCYEV